MKNLILLISFSLLIITASAQDDTSPFCKYFEITKMQFNHNTGKDTLYVTVYNDCDSCGQNVYTGIIVYRGEVISLGIVEDTLAIDRYYFAEWTPENNSERTYAAIVKKDFDLNEEFKVGLVGVCNIIPLSPDVILKLNKESINSKKKVVLRNNRLLIPDPDQTIKDVSIYNLSGQLALKETAVNNTFYDLKIAEPGLYLVSVTLSSGEEANLKYVNY